MMRRFALKVPANLPLVEAAPLLCAGITTYSPMKHYGLDKAGQKLAVVGLGGLGHMAVKFGKGELLLLASSALRPCTALTLRLCLAPNPVLQEPAVSVNGRAAKTSASLTVRLRSHC